MSSKKTFVAAPNRPLTSHETDLLARLIDMPDESIDTIDIPEITLEAWRDQRRPGSLNHRRRP